MRRSLLFAALVILASSRAVVHAEDRSALAVLRQEFQTRVPKHWQVRLSQRERFILVSLMPPNQEAFDLWYDPEKQLASLRRLCPEPGHEIWGLIGPDQDIVLDPTVGGKSVPQMRLSCRKLMAG